jgi:hypothetical protein
MAGTTTNFAIPYPSSTDYVTDGATAMKSLADQVDAAMFTGSSSGNLLDNGAMQVTQRSPVGTVVTGLTGVSINTADRWNTAIGALGTWSQTTLADAPTGSGFRNCLRMQCTTADASPAVGDFLIIQQKIEGQNLQVIRKGTASAQTLTLSFWVASFQTGTFIVELEDTDNSRSVSKSYTVSASNTWEYKTVTFPADTTGAFDNDANASMSVNFWLGSGTNYSSGTLATTWGTRVDANRAVGCTNVASSTSNKWHITGAQLTVGSVAVPFEFKSFADDLDDCQRYYFRKVPSDGAITYATFGTVSTTAAIIFATIYFPTTMRTAPTSFEVSAVGTWYVEIPTSAGAPTALSQTYRATQECFQILWTKSGLASGEAGQLLQNNNSASYISASADL